MPCKHTTWRHGCTNIPWFHQMFYLPPLANASKHKCLLNLIEGEQTRDRQNIAKNLAIIYPHMLAYCCCCWLIRKEPAQQTPPTPQSTAAARKTRLMPKSSATSSIVGIVQSSIVLLRRRFSFAVESVISFAHFHSENCPREKARSWNLRRFSRFARKRSSGIDSAVVLVNGF